MDLTALLLVRPRSAAEAVEIILALIGSGGIGVLVVGALALLQSAPRDSVLLEQALRVMPVTLATSRCALVALTPLPYSPEMTRSLAFTGSLLAHAASIRLHIVREAWALAEHGPPGCHVRVSVLKHRLAAGSGEARVLIRFADEGRMTS